MAKGTDAESVLVLSRVRTGLKREFEFALKVQSEICGTLGRTRSRKGENGAIGSPESGSNKRLKKDVKMKKGKDREAVGVEQSLTVVEDSVDSLSVEEAKSDVVDLDEPKIDRAGEIKVPVSKNSKIGELEKDVEVEDGILEPMCEDEIDKDGASKSLTNYEALEKTPEKALKMYLEDKEKNQGKPSTMELEDVNREAETENKNMSEKEPMDAGEDDSGGDANMDQGKENEPENLMRGENEMVEVNLGMKNEQQNGNEEGSSDKMTILSGCGLDTKTENVFVEKPSRRFTRSSLKQKVEPVKKSGGNVVEQDTYFKSGIDGETSLKHEINSSTNVARNALMKLKDLLDSGMLEGINVKYIRHSKGTRCTGVNGLSGVISGSGILCFCHACKGDKVVSPTLYELHAGSLNKHPAEYIHLENGKTLRDVMNVTKESV